MKHLTQDGLPGSHRGVARAECDPAFRKKVRNIFRRICRKWRNPHITIVCIDEIRLDIESLAKREIAQLIMEYNDHKGEGRL